MHPRLRTSLPALTALLLAAGCGPSSAPAPQIAPPPPPPPPAAEPVIPAAVRYARMTEHLRERLTLERAKRRATVEENVALYRQIRADFSLPETLAAAWDWITKACAVENAGPTPAEIVWDDRLGVAVIAGREPTSIALPFDEQLSLDLRWVEPGAFVMGSPPGERDRNVDEALHEVVVANGFWLGQFELTQAQWYFVMGHNQAHFTHAGPRAPMENVSAEDLPLFFVRLNALVQQGHLPWVGVLFRLPTEAEWEFACRAGTRTATYAGELQPVSPNNCPGLDAIAWYGGNCGVAYAGGWDSSKWQGLQFPHTAAGPHPAGAKQANAWGFHDMLGNVAEWTADDYAPYPGGIAVTDRAGQRVIRGGSWGSGAGPCRAAARDTRPPATRHNRIGFRVAASW